MIRQTVFGLALTIGLGMGAVLPAPALAQAGDAGRGKTLFQQRCAMCHSVVPKGTGVGPNLAGVVGRKAGTAGFAYSPAVKKSGLVWDGPTLDSYLAAPMKKIPGARMAVATPAAADRRDIIVYLTGIR